MQFDFLSVLVGFLFLNYCCPSFGCARRHSVSTYTSILAGSLWVVFVVVPQVLVGVGLGCLFEMFLFILGRPVSL